MDAFSSRHRSVVLAMLERERAPVVDAPQAGTAGATFEDIYRDHYRDVYRYVLLSLRRPDDVEDVVADTFDRAFAAWRSGHGPAGRPLPWLLLIARRIVVDRWRRNRLLRWLPLAIGTARSGTGATTWPRRSSRRPWCCPCWTANPPSAPGRASSSWTATATTRSAPSGSRSWRPDRAADRAPRVTRTT